MNAITKNNFLPQNITTTTDKFYGTDEQILFAGISISILSLFGLPADILIFFLILRRAELRRGNNSFIILNLLLADMFCLLSINILNVAAQWYKQDLLCTISAVITYTTAFCSWFNYLLLSLYLYSILRHPQFIGKYASKKALFALLCFAWVGPLLIFTPLFLTGGFGFEDMQFCGCNFNETWKFYYNIFVLVGFWIGICYLGSLSCIFQIIRELKRSKAPFGLTRSVVKKLRSELFLLILYGIFPVFMQVPLVTIKVVPGISRYAWIGRVLLTLYALEFALTPFLVLGSHKAYFGTLKQMLTRRIRNGELGTGIKTSTSKLVLVEYFVDPKEMVR